MAPRPVREQRPAPLARRSLLVGAAAWCACATGCSDGTGRSQAAPAASASRSSRTAGPGTPAASSAGAALPAPVPWRPGPGEVTPEAKAAAVRLVEALGTWRPGRAGPAARLAALGVAPARAARLAAQAGPLTPRADEAVVTVIDAQYGGILADSASVLVVCGQRTRGGGTTASGGTTVDVRLSRTGSGWAVTSLHPADPGPPVAPGAYARAVLAQPRIELPPASVADVRSGRVHESVLRAMLRLADSHRMSVSVVRSGHPLDVFGTDRPSDHPRGRAFDVWRVDGHPVVDPATSRSLITGFMRRAADVGSYNVGGPVPLTGGATANQFFSDATHHDHVHIGFTT
ncbi:hypothetical protein [Streptomyces sp. cg36]|uniref:hypothetical protein n=1 Tax=Streptomyces sp. cg36 TaxID=3238798 RepID=UPI0034E1E128